MKLLLLAALALTPIAAQDTEPAKRLQEAAAVFSEIMATTDISKAQESLNAKGFDVGPPDGRIGPRTREGIRKFQASESMPVNGLLDDQTAGKLEVGPESAGG